jgi:hypothetical protein
MTRLQSVPTKDFKAMWEFCEKDAAISAGQKLIGEELAQKMFPKMRVVDVGLRYAFFKLFLKRRGINLDSVSPLFRQVLFIFAAHRPIKLMNS